MHDLPPFAAHQLSAKFASKIAFNRLKTDLGRSEITEDQ